jgi:hypothetical protein
MLLGNMTSIGEDDFLATGSLSTFLSVGAR